jgi:glycosyltransferase involved in cell wall biosynthesis
MQRVLNIAPYPFLPAHSGGQKLIGFFNEYLGKQCDLHVAGTKSNDKALVKNYRLHPVFERSPVRYINLFHIRRLSRIIKQYSIDTFIMEHPYMGMFAWPIKRKWGIRLIIHTHNIEYLRFKSIGKWWWFLLKKYECWIFKKADLIFCISEEDKQTILHDTGIEEHKCVIVPYGIKQHSKPTDKKNIKEKICRDLQIDPATPLLFFNGQLDYKPNLDALNRILHDLLPLLQKKQMNYHLVIAGKGLPSTYDQLKSWKHHHVTYTGFVSDIDAYTCAADVLLNPVNSGGGVKTKVIEALGLNTSVVSTETGARGVNKDICGEKLKVCPDNDSEAFVEAIRECIQLSEDIPEAFYDYYYWGNIIDRIVRL